MKEFSTIAPDNVKEIMTQKGYKIFEEEGIPNIVGVRNSAYDENDAYNDRCFVWWRKQNGKDEWHSYTITTHPGYYYLHNPIAGTSGTAILVPDQYLNCWALGMHRQKQFALCQTEGAVKVYRDNNRDTILDYLAETIVEGFWGINLHHGYQLDSNVIDHFSAGCQVWRYHQAHEILMQKFQALSDMYHFKRFSYTLLLQSDFQ